MKDLAALLIESGARVVLVEQGSIVEDYSQDLLNNEQCLSGVTEVAPLGVASSNQISFINNARYREQLTNSDAGAVILNEGFIKSYSGLAIIHDNPYWLYAKVSCLYQADIQTVHRGQKTVDPSASVAVDAQLGKDVNVCAGAVVESGAVIGNESHLGANAVVSSGASLGNRVKLGAGAKILRDCVLGDDVIVDAGAVIGSEGFGFAPYQEEQQLRWQRIAQLGIVRVGSRVYIGANTTVDRGAIEDTVIEDDVIIDNQVQIAHNCKIGRGTAIAGCVGMAGSSIVGERCSIGGGAGIAGHLTIADDTVVLGMTLINKSVKQKGVYASGTGMQSADQWRKSAVRFTQLEKLNQRVRQLEQEAKKSQD